MFTKFLQNSFLMKVTILLFGIVRDIVQSGSISLESDSISTVASLKTLLFEKYSKLKTYSNFSIAVNEEYVEDSYVLKNNDTVAIIPPVSGG